MAHRRHTMREAAHFIYHVKNAKLLPAPVAQWIARWTLNQEVVGSSPPAATNIFSLSIYIDGARIRYFWLSYAQPQWINT